MNNDNLKQLRKVLTRLGRKNSVPTEKATGVCVNIIRICALPLNVHYPHYYETVQRWTHYSGVALFPIRCPEEYKHLYPGQYYYHYCPDRWAGQQGDMHRKFCRYLVRELNKYCKKNGIKL